uniref:Uncharacterized protein n=1 Tax=Odontella aurita TaxID=265563 RepID=A0A7S4I9Q9_9STRA|mmetsp:Transcript_21695/g.63794  ORF Transcript_21695/g.63794 Transcript_21695/m.63794 type:complete len:250 (+) Transcript_21695:225-974(+)
MTAEESNVSSMKRLPSFRRGSGSGSSICKRQDEAGEAIIKGKSLTKGSSMRQLLRRASSRFSVRSHPDDNDDDDNNCNDNDDCNKDELRKEQPQPLQQQQQEPFGGERLLKLQRRRRSSLGRKQRIRRVDSLELLKRKDDPYRQASTTYSPQCVKQIRRRSSLLNKAKSLSKMSSTSAKAFDDEEKDEDHDYAFDLGREVFDLGREGFYGEQEDGYMPRARHPLLDEIYGDSDDDQEGRIVDDGGQISF